jgi:hypothetical protein
MHKKKLLITLGCSYTEGVGCYIPELLVDNNPTIPVDEIYTRSLSRFHTLGWPAHLQKKLQYDCLYNLGKASASNSQTVKQWFERFSDTNLSTEFEVLVFWLVTFPGRISFYRNGKVTSLLPSTKYGCNLDEDLYQSYVQFLGDAYNKDTMLETHFYVNIIKNICDMNKYNFLYLNTLRTDGEELDSLMQSRKNSLNSYISPLYNQVMDGFTKENNMLSFCNHPNEKGYEVMADRIFNGIQQEHPQLINTQYQPELYEMKFLGDPKQW